MSGCLSVVGERPRRIIHPPGSAREQCTMGAPRLLPNASILSTIDDPEDLRRLPVEKLWPLASDLRAFLIESVLRTSWHLAAGLGVVELSIALHS
jgi:hypothetical protein